MPITMDNINSQLADSYLQGTSWSDIPGATIEMFTKVVNWIEEQLQIGYQQLRPTGFYRGIGMEADKHSQGVEITELYHHSCPASQLGAQIGDVITKVNINHEWVDLSRMDLLTALQQFRVSSLVGIKLEVMRDTSKIVLGEGMEIKTQLIDTQNKFPLNFTARSLGNQLRGLNFTTTTSYSPSLPTKSKQYMQIG